MNAVTVDSLSDRIEKIIKSRSNYAKNVRQFLLFAIDRAMIADFSLCQHGSKFHVSLIMNNGKKASRTFTVTNL